MKKTCLFLIPNGHGCRIYTDLDIPYTLNEEQAKKLSDQKTIISNTNFKIARLDLSNSDEPKELVLALMKNHGELDHIFYMESKSPDFNLYEQSFPNKLEQIIVEFDLLGIQSTPLKIILDDVVSDYEFTIRSDYFGNIEKIINAIKS